MEEMVEGRQWHEASLVKDEADEMEGEECRLTKGEGCSKVSILTMRQELLTERLVP